MYTFLMAIPSEAVVSWPKHSFITFQLQWLEVVNIVTRHNGTTNWFAMMSKMDKRLLFFFLVPSQDLDWSTDSAGHDNQLKMVWGYKNQLGIRFFVHRFSKWFQTCACMKGKTRKTWRVTGKWLNNNWNILTNGGKGEQSRHEMPEWS